MTKKTATPKQMAKILVSTSLNVSRSHFTDIVAYALQDNSPSEVEAVRKHMPPALRIFLPLKYLH
jgi:hypothetical protein